jgi:hypothetical protein
MSCNGKVVYIHHSMMEYTGVYPVYPTIVRSWSLGLMGSCRCSPPALTCPWLGSLVSGSTLPTLWLRGLWWPPSAPVTSSASGKVGPQAGGSFIVPRHTSGYLDGPVPQGWPDMKSKRAILWLSYHQCFDVLFVLSLAALNSYRCAYAWSKLYCFVAGRCFTLGRHLVY